MSKLAPPAREQGVTVQAGSTGGGGNDDVLDISIKNLFLKLSPFNSKKDLVAGCLVGFSHQQQKSIIERALNKYVMDRIEGFDDCWPCRKKSCSVLTMVELNNTCMSKEIFIYLIQ